MTRTPSAERPSTSRMPSLRKPLPPTREPPTHYDIPIASNSPKQCRCDDCLKDEEMRLARGIR